MKVFSIKATNEVDFSSYLHIMMTNDMLKYYMIFPKIIFTEFAVFYATADMALELQLEIEMVLGLNIKFEPLPDFQILNFINQIDSKEGIPQ